MLTTPPAAVIDWLQFMCEYLPLLSASPLCSSTNRVASFQTLESDHYVCVRQKLNEDEKPQVIIVNLKNNNEVVKRPINADSAIMHWNKNIIALKAQSRTIQIFDLTAKQKLKSAVMSEDVVFWKWYNERSLGLVTDNSIYHWDVFDPTQNQPQKVFDRLHNLSVCFS